MRKTRLAGKVMRGKVEKRAALMVTIGAGLMVAETKKEVSAWRVRSFPIKKEDLPLLEEGLDLDSRGMSVAGIEEFDAFVLKVREHFGEKDPELADAIVESFSYGDPYAISGVECLREEIPTELIPMELLAQMKDKSVELARTLFGEE